MRDRSRPAASGRVEVDPAAGAIGDGRPLEPPGTWTASSPIDKSEIDRRRLEFWDTAPAYEGRQEIWEAIKAACETADTATAQAILDASEIMLPNGSLTNCYDSTGLKYVIPRFCLSYPDNMTSQAAAAAVAQASRRSTSPHGAPTASPTPVGSVLHDAPAPMSPVSPASPASPGSPGGGEGVLKIKIRLSNGTDTVLEFATTDTSLQAKQRLLEEHKIATARMRVYFVGKSVPDRVPLSGLGLARNDVLQVMVLPEPKK